MSFQNGIKDYEGYSNYMNYMIETKQMIVDSTPKTVRCNRCGVGGLHWVEENGKFRLHYSNNRKHSC